MVHFCVTCCAPFTLLAGLLMLFFSRLVEGGNQTFAVIGASKNWDMASKSKSLLIAGCFYIGVSLLLWIRIIVAEKFPRCADVVGASSSKKGPRLVSSGTGNTGYSTIH